MRTRIQAWGNSQGIRLPKALLEEVNMKTGDEIRLVVSQGRIQLEAVRPVRGRYKLEDLLDRIGTGETNEVDWGEPFGREEW